MNVHRLFVGGVPYDVKREDLVKRFRTFGKVTNVELVPAKGPDAHSGLQFRAILCQHKRCTLDVHLFSNSSR